MADDALASHAAPLTLSQALRAPMPLYKAALGFSVVTGFMVLVPTFYMLEVYDRVLNSRSATTLWMLLLLAAAAYLWMELLDLVRGRLLTLAGRQVDRLLRGRLFDAAFNLQLQQSGGKAGAAQQVFSDLRTLCEFVPSTPVLAALDAPASLLFLLIVFAIDPVLGLLALVGLTVQVVIAYRTERGTMPALIAANRAAIEARAYATGALRSTPTLQAMGMQGGIRARWHGLQRQSLLLQAQASEINALNSAGSRVLQTLQGSVILGASCWLVLVGEFSASGGLMIVASVLGARVLAPLAQLVANWRTVVQARDAFARLDRLLANTPQVPRSMPLPAPRGVLSVEQVVAGPPDSQSLILRGVSFTAQPGEVLAVIGPSASGKTTLARLLTGIWPTRGGKVRLDGADVHAWNRDELGPHLGYLSQQVELFEGTLAENIARFGPVDLPQVQAAADLVGLRAVIEALPDAWDTRLGPDGAFLSGGMRQRVALARALYGRPRLVVLDEPNASLDEAGDQALVSALQQLKAAGSTVVVISHRTSILPVADKLLVLRDGAVVAHGPRDEVLAGMRQAAGGAAAAAPRPGAGVAVAVSAGSAA